MAAGAAAAAVVLLKPPPPNGMLDGCCVEGCPKGEEDGGWTAGFPKGLLTGSAGLVSAGAPNEEVVAGWPNTLEGAVVAGAAGAPNGLLTGAAACGLPKTLETVDSG